jgi:hypothetical protein
MEGLGTEEGNKDPVTFLEMQRFHFCPLVKRLEYLKVVTKM